MVHRTFQDPQAPGGNGGAVDAPAGFNCIGGVVDAGHLATSLRKNPGNCLAAPAADVEHPVSGADPRCLQSPPVQAGVPDVHAAQKHAPGQAGGAGELRFVRDSGGPGGLRGNHGTMLPGLAGRAQGSLRNELALFQLQYWFSSSLLLWFRPGAR